jgi:hypothetical protein
LGRFPAAETANAEAKKVTVERKADVEVVRMLLDIAAKVREKADKKAALEMLGIKNTFNNRLSRSSIYKESCKEGS